MLKNVKLNNFGIHKRLDIDFKQGLNAIIGENTAGKTQVMESICYALFGKTQNSKLEKIINFDSTKASVEINLNEKIIERDRTSSTTSLNKISKLELDNLLNLEYKEFLSIFYISSQEQQNLFDASYLRNFLISLFNLDEYSNIYNKLKVEYNTLIDIKESNSYINKDSLKKRFNKVKIYMQNTNEKIENLNNALEKTRIKSNTLFNKKGMIEQKYRDINRKKLLLEEGKCSKCERPYSKEDIKLGLEKIKNAVSILKDKERKLINFLKQIDLIEKKEIQAKNNLIDTVNRCKNIMYKIKELSNRKATIKNDKRIKELETLMSVFSPKAFPSYLLQAYVPIIINTANKLLRLIFVNTTVDIRTERPESNKPDFKPFIKRSDKILELKDLSGSERVLVNLCFRLGIISIFKQLCKTEIDFMLIDEGLEKVDNKNSIKLLQLFKYFFNLNFLNQIIFVTHKDILKEQEDINYIELRRES